MFDSSSRLLLTATLSPEAENVLKSKAELPHLITHRYVTNRREVHLLRVEDANLFQWTGNFIERALPLLVTSTPGSAPRLIVFTCSYASVHTMVKELTSRGIHALEYTGKLDDEQKISVYKQWTNETKTQIVIATDSFGAGKCMFNLIRC